MNIKICISTKMEVRPLLPHEMFHSLLHIYYSEWMESGFHAKLMKYSSQKLDDGYIPKKISWRGPSEDAHKFWNLQISSQWEIFGEFSGRKEAQDHPLSNLALKGDGNGEQYFSYNLTGCRLHQLPKFHLLWPRFSPWWDESSLGCPAPTPKDFFSAQSTHARIANHFPPQPPRIHQIIARKITQI